MRRKQQKKKNVFKKGKEIRNKRNGKEERKRKMKKNKRRKITKMEENH